MASFKRGNFRFVSFKGDHSPKHVHVYKDGRMVVKWDLENWQPMQGQATRAVLKHIEALVEEGKL